MLEAAVSIGLPVASGAAPLYKQAIDFSTNNNSSCAFNCFTNTWWGDGLTLGGQSNVTGFSFEIWQLKSTTNTISNIQWALFNDGGTSGAIARLGASALLLLAGVGGLTLMRRKKS